MPATIRVGTSGWSYPEGAGSWNGIFYPPRGTRGFRANDELSYYAEHFDTVEVNSTFYRPPSPATTRKWAERTPPGFEFSIKLHQKFTHAGMIGRGQGLSSAARGEGQAAALPPASREDVEEFQASLDPLAQAGKLGPVLAQFPAGFRSTTETREYLADLLLDFREYALAIELRHKSWSDDGARTAALLNEVGAAWVQIDEPKFRFSIRQDFAANTPDCYYLRLHGRNAAQWWRHDSPDDRYNYLYTPAELKPFAETVKDISGGVRKAYLYLNNHFAAKAVVNATILKHQLGIPVEGEFRDEMVERYAELKGIVRTGGSLL